MKCLTPVTVALLATAALLTSDGAHAQARGPSAAEVLENGQDVGNSQDRTRTLSYVMARVLADQYGVDPDNLDPDIRYVPETGLVLQKGTEQTALDPPIEVLDDTARVQKLVEQQVWLKRLTGRFRIDGDIKGAGVVVIPPPLNELKLPPPLTLPEPTVLPIVLSGKVSGVADCTGVGEGAGVHCIVNATWPIIEWELPPIGMPPSASELLNIYRPAMLVFGFNPDTAEVRALLVTDNSLAHSMTGRLTGNALNARRQRACRLKFPPEPCFQILRVVAEPESETVTIVLGSGPPATTIKLVMHRDPEARAEKEMKRKKVR